MKNQKPRNKNQKLLRQRGFTLLLAALVSSIVVAIGTSIFVIAQKQLILSSISRDSQYAFYAADTGAECALYWDFRHELFPTTTQISVPLSCDAQGIDTTSPAAGVSEFDFTASGYCTHVKVTKTTVDGNRIQTEIRADGHNVKPEGGDSVNCDETIAENPRALQRSVELRY